MQNRLRPAFSLLAALLLATWPAQPALATDTGSFTAQYDGYAHGLIALKMTGALTLTPGAYSGRLSYHTAGMIGWMVHNVSESTAEGRFKDDAAAPERFDSSGNLRGTDRVTHMTYRDGNPVVLQILPPPGLERTLVAPGDTLHTIDTLSAIAMLVRRFGAAGSCDGKARVFDGHRLTDLTASTVGPEVLPPTAKSHFSGPTVRCDFVGLQLGGFMKGQDEAKLRAPRHGSAWLAPVVAGAPPVPVRVTFEHPLLGLVTLYLTSVTGGPAAVAQIPAPSRQQ
jgi:hypothetical protein